MAKTSGARPAADAAVAAIDGERLWRRLMSMAEIGATAKGGVNRPTLSPDDVRAKRLLADWARARGFAVSQDALGNLFVRRAGREGAAPVMTGSHLDSQPTGGKFDGAYGVLAGLEVIEAIDDAGIETRRPIEVAAWTNEEGWRFQPGCTGSLHYTRQIDLARLAGVRDWNGVGFAAALEECLAALPLPVHDGAIPSAYVEAHIEQGPRLEAAALTIGVVDAVQGSEKWLVTITGEDAHAGTTPHALRRDALQAAVAAIAALGALMADPADVMRFTVGRLVVEPGSPNVVPGRCTFTIDMRHPDLAVIDRLSARVPETIADAAARHGCSVEAKRLAHVDPTRFDPGIVAAVRAAASGLGLPHMDMISGAGHDAMHLAKICPSGMIFIPCARGVSHNETESATAADCAAGARVLAATLLKLAQS
ncbi:MAG: Zn-dependent hydrolase [Alphaproteobacteria bacterium]|nr:Zn-dependent hydrolase [Alphaproteobacteria bacterium]